MCDYTRARTRTFLAAALARKCSPLTQPQPGDCSSQRTDVSHTISDHNNSGHAGLALLFIDKDDVMT